MDGEGQDQLVLKGKTADYLGVAGRVKYEARLRAEVVGGSLLEQDADLIVDKADSVTL